jgi:DNA polymerase-1
MNGRVAQLAEPSIDNREVPGSNPGAPTIFAVDFETALIEPGLQIPPPVCMSAAVRSSTASALFGAGIPIQRQTGIGYVFDARAALDLLDTHLRGGGSLVGLNIPFDLAVACEARNTLLPLVIEAYDADRITDVIVRQKLIDIAEGTDAHGKYGMADLSWRLLDRYIEKEDTWRLRYWELVHLPLSQWPREALEYSAGDAVITLDLYEVQERSLAEIDRLCVLADQYRQARADFALRLASAWGLRTNAEGCRRLREQCEKGIAELQPVLVDAGLLKPKYKGRKPNKVQVGVTKCTGEAKRRIFDSAAASEPDADPWKLVKITKTGIDRQREGLPWRDLKYVSTDKEACRDCDDPIMQDFSRYSQLENMLGGFVEAIEQGIHAPIHTHFEVLLDTGRTSSSNPNVQNVRTVEGSRECFIPRAGWAFIGCDIDRAELHTLAQTCIDLFGHSTLGDSLNAGIDPHTKFGARLAGCSYEELRARVGANDPEAKKLRQRAKPANFGLPGGMGPRGLRAYAKSMYNIVLPPAEIQALVDSWREEYPDIAGDYLGWIGRLVAGTGYATIEHFISQRWRGNVRYCQAANSFFQGRAADGLKAALWAVMKKCYLPGTPLHGCRIVNEIHDEILIESPLAQASDAAHEMGRTMRDAYNEYTQDVPVSCTPVVMDCWSKGAIPIVEDGAYRVWRYERKIA